MDRFVHQATRDRSVMVRYWDPFLESPETFRAYFGCHNFLHILKTKVTFAGMKFALSDLEIIVKNQLYRISGLQF